MDERRTCAEIDLGKLISNVNTIKSYINKDVKIGAVIKADAYGHGAVRIIKELSKDERIQMALVGTEEEAIEIYESGCALPLLILGNVLGFELERLIMYDFIFSAYSMEFLRYADFFAKRRNIKIRIHIRIDVLDIGMGLGIAEFMKCQKEIFEMNHISIEGIYAHLYSSYCFQKDIILKELNLFSKIVNLLSEDIKKKVIIHIANSALLFEYPDYHFNMVRTGTALYGLPCNPEDRFGLHPILTLKTRIHSIKDIRENQTVSYYYNADCNVSESQNNPTVKIAQISLGYWDCPLILTKNNIEVWIKGKLYRLKEEACMDNSCIDITESNGIQVGDEVIILGDKPGITLSVVLNRLDIALVHSEWVCLISKRLTKKYINSLEISLRYTWEEK